METLIYTDFIQALSDPNVQDFCVGEINSLYKGFIKSLIVLCDSIFDYKQLFRELTFAIVQLKLLSPEAAEDVPLTQKYITAAIALLESELHLLNERINHPALFQPAASIKGYDIHLSKRYTKHDLIELLASVDCANVFVDSRGDAILQTHRAFRRSARHQTVQSVQQAGKSPGPKNQDHEIFARIAGVAY